MHRALLFALLLLFSSFASAQSPWPDLSIPAPPQFNPGKDVAVIVGIENYAELPKVTGADLNAEAWYLYFTVTLGLPENRVSLLTNKRGTREKMLKALAQQSKQAVKGGSLWFVFVGHGAPGIDKNGGLLLGYDTQSEIDSLQERCVSVQEVLDTIKKGKQSKIVMLLDSGLNGHIPEGELLFGLEHDHSAKPFTIKDVAATFKKKSKQELTLMTAATGEQYAGQLTGANVPAFSYLALGGIRGWADTDLNDIVTPQELRDYIAGILMITAVDQLQTPVLAASNSESSLSTFIEEGPELKTVLATLSGKAEPKTNPPKDQPRTTPKENPNPGNPKTNPPKEDPKTNPPKDNSSKLGGAKKGPEAIEEMILQKINAARAEEGLKPQTQQSNLLQAARDHSQEMAELGYFSHQSPTPGLETFIDRISVAGAKGFTTAGENIVFRQQDMSDADMAEALFQQWMNSPGHRENILTEEFLVTGLGVFQDGPRCWATQVFADQVRK